MSDNTKGASFSIPWPAIMALLTAIGGALLYFSNLASDRPAATPGREEPALGFQDVNARLWQDPFCVVDQKLQSDNDKEKESKCRCSRHPESSKIAATQCGGGQPDHTRCELTHEIADAKKNGNVLILGVLVSGGPYAELGEQRLRQRVGVLEGLASCGFEPADSEHIGYIQIGWFGKPDHFGRPPSWDELKNNLELDQLRPSLTLPYEWCEPAHPLLPSGQMLRPNTQFGRVLVVWVNEDAIRDYPLRRLGIIRSALTTLPTNCFKSNVVLKFIGPRVSTTLRAMVEESQATDIGTIKDVLCDVEMYSPTASADQIMLYDGIFDLSKTVPALSDLLWNCSGLHLIRTNFTDDRICFDLYQELILRCKNRWKDLGDVAIVSEWDTFYGKALPICFCAAIKNPRCGAQQCEFEKKLLACPKARPKTIHPFFYLRGIDGNTPTAGGETDSNKSSGNTNSPKPTQSLKFESPSEAPEGLNQSDYLRRLADQLAELDRQIRKSDLMPTGLTAVGILGTDLYDKLLILRALRDRLPGVIFFTIDLDARYSLPTEWPASHNLIISSSYGLSLDQSYQYNFPFFRDSNQTAIYAATLFALHAVQLARGPSDQEDIKNLLIAPRRFEISRTGAFDITPLPREDMEIPNSIAGPHRADYSVQPIRVLIPQVLCAIAALVFVLVVCGFGFRPTKIEWEECRPFVPLIFGFVGMYVVLAIFPLICGSTGEVLSFFGGISIWPTEAVRCLSLGLTFFFIRFAKIRLERNDKRLEKEFKLAPLDKAQKYADYIKKSDALNPETLKSKRLNLNLGWEVFGVPSDPNNPKPDEWPTPLSEQKARDDPLAKVYAQNVWWHYRMRGRWSVRKLRILTCSAAYLVTVVFFVIFFLHTKIPVPARGLFALWVDRIILLLSVASSIVLVLFVLDASYLNCLVIRYLTRMTTHWPPKAFTNVVENVDCHELSEYLDIRFIAKRTKISGEVIYYPFITFLLMILSRNSFFDDWSWPMGLILIFAMNFALAIIAALTLRTAAEHARRCAIEGIMRRQQRFVVADKQAMADVMGKLLERVRTESEGAFSILSGHPFLAAVLLPAGSVGAWIILQYFSQPMH
jgi:hypothetical protein